MVSFRLTGAGPRSASPVVSRIAYQAGLSACGKAVVSEVSVSHQCRPDSAFGDVASGDLDLTRPTGTAPATVSLSAADAFYATNFPSLPSLRAPVLAVALKRARLGPDIGPSH